MTMNPVQYYWKNRIEQQPINVQHKLQALKEKGHLTDELVLIQKKRPVIKAGDVFVVQPRENIYFYGVVINTCSLPSCKNKIVACIFKNITHYPTMDDFAPDFNNLLLPPLSLFKEPWTSGYFLNIGNIDLESVNIPSYGFYHTFSESIVSEYGTRLTKQPALLGLTAMDGIGAVAYKITQELIINPELLGDNCKPSKQDFCEKMPQILREYGHPLYV